MLISNHLVLGGSLFRTLISIMHGEILGGSQSSYPKSYLYWRFQATKSEFDVLRRFVQHFTTPVHFRIT